MRFSAVTVLVLGAATLGCGSKVCLLLPYPVILFDIRDSITNAPIAYRASLIVEGNGVYDSTYVGPRADSLTVSFVQSAPPRRTGDYTVRVRRTGYRLWEQNNVHLGDPCTGAKSVSFVARLQRLP